MPALRDLKCWIETPILPRLREYATTYGDNAVETFVAIPEGLGPFSIKLQNSKFVWTGLAVVVFIDGVRQTSRVKMGMVDDKDSGKWQKTFTLRKKEEVLSMEEGRCLSRGWTFEKLNFGTQILFQSPNFDGEFNTNTSMSSRHKVHAERKPCFD